MPAGPLDVQTHGICLKIIFSEQKSGEPEWAEEKNCKTVLTVLCGKVHRVLSSHVDVLHVVIVMMGQP